MTLKRGGPMKRTAFARKALPERAPRERTTYVPAPVVRRGSYGPSSAVVVAMPKPVEHRRPRLLALAQGEPCLLRVPGVCVADPTTTVACHSNWSEHGKAGARKADDHFSVWGCHACHVWLDQLGSATYEVKRATWAAAHVLQVAHWRLIEADIKRPDPDRAAVRWALELLAI